MHRRELFQFLCLKYSFRILRVGFLPLVLAGGAIAQTPQITTISPTSATAGGPAFTLTINGSNFDRNSDIVWNNITLNTDFGSAAQLTGNVSASLIRNPATIPISVETGNRVSNTVNFVINAATAPLTITTTSPLLGATVGAAYSQTLSASGGTLPYRWAILNGTFPSGLTLSTVGVISGTPSASGIFSFTIQLSDASQATVTKAFTLTIVAPPPPIPTLTITTATPLAGGTAGTAYSQTITASGGVPPYRWSLPSGAFPPGLSLSVVGVVSGTPSSSGTFNFTVQVTDSAQANASKGFSITIAPSATPPPGPTVPALSLTGLPGVASPAQQMPLTLRLASTFPQAITGDLAITFAPDAVVFATDAALQFSTGGTSVTFTVPANGTQATFPTSNLMIQSGTISGRITITAHVRVSGTDMTPSPAPSWTVQIDRAVPRINGVTVTRSGSTFNVVVVGFSTPREVTQATFRFSPSSGGLLQTTEVTVSVNATFQTWYRNSSSNQFGSQFTLTQPFTVQGDPANVGGVSVILTNSVGASPGSNASF